MPVRALGLFSGGLDSHLAAALLASQGVEVRCVHFRTGFGGAARSDAVRRARDAAAGPPLRVVDVAADYLREVVRQPCHGYGAAMNPCLDCRIFMLRRAAVLCEEERCSLVFTGEVLGQRSMDQCRSALERVEREAGLEGRVLRPLSAGLLPETTAERAGEVRRERLGRLHGRSRRGQAELAVALGVTGCPTPSGLCCRLAERGYALRLRDLLAHAESAEPDRVSLELLGRGRHFRVAWDVKVIVARDEAESRWLADRAVGRWVCQTAGGRGAVALLEGEPDERGLRGAASLAARYGPDRRLGRVQVLLRRGDELRELAVAPAPDEALRRWRLATAQTTPTGHGVL